MRRLKKDVHGQKQRSETEQRSAEILQAYVAGQRASKLHDDLLGQLRAELEAQGLAGSSEQEPLLVVKDLTVHYETEDGLVQAVNGVSFSLDKQRALGIVGETGAGKTTTALALMNLVPDPPGKIVSGSVKMDQVNLLDLPMGSMEAIRGNDIAMIFQDPMTALNPVLTVGEQIAESYELHRAGMTHEEALMKAKEMLELVGIPGSRASDYPHQFSGGMRQRVVIAIALACSPRLLIADEPTTALDVTIQAQVLVLMKELMKKYAMSLILITHDLGVVAEVCDDVAVMYAGSIVEIGSADDIFNQTRHPYTEGLFNSLPNLRKRGEALYPIQGLMPDPTDLPLGCPFAPRCPYQDARCHSERPTLTTVAGRHAVACHAYERDGFALERYGRSEKEVVDGE